MDKGDAGGLPKHTTTKKTLALPRRLREIFCFWCQDPSASRFATISSLRWTQPTTFTPPPTSFTCFNLRRTEWDGGAGGTETYLQTGSGFSFFFVLPVALRGKRGAKEGGGELKFQNGASCLYFTPLMLPPHLPPRLPPTFISITPAIMTLRRESESERQHLGASFCLQDEISTDALRIRTVRCKTYSQICTMSSDSWRGVCFREQLNGVAQSAASRWILFSIGIMSRSLKTTRMISCLIYFSFYLWCWFFFFFYVLLFLWILNDVFINWKR